MTADIEALGEVVHEITKALQPLAEHERARVLLFVALKYVPNTDDAVLLNLLQLAKEPPT